MTAFPEDYEIQISRLVKLWVAEGFVRPNESKTLDDEAEEYLEDLVQRNLVLVRKKRSNGALKTVGIHDLLREICVTKAEQEGFFHHVTPKNSQQGIENNRRRYIIHSTISQKFLQNILGSATSSLIFFPAIGFQMLTDTLDIRHVEIFDALDVIFNVFPVQITEAVSLRYLAFTYGYKHESEFPSSISNLRNLHTLIVNKRSSSFASNNLYLPLSILQMPKLRHLILFNCSYIQIPRGFVPTVQETNLHTLSHVTNLKLSEEVIYLLKNLKTMGLNYLFLSNQDCESYYLNNLVRLQNLEVLSLVVKLEKPDELPSFSPANFAFPTSLKILTLKDCGIAWADMTLVGSLPNLEVLKLIDRAFIGSEWCPIEGEFLRLKYLRFDAGNLEYWGAESTHFPRLETLIIYNATWNEIPSGIGEIETLQMIELHYCNRCVIHSGKRIQQEQQDMGNESLQLRVYSKKKIVIQLPMNSGNIKKKALRIAMSMHGVDQEAIVTENNELLVTGEGIDVLRLVQSLRKKFGFADIKSVAEGGKKRMKTPNF